MTVKQEETSPIEDYFLKVNLPSIFDHITEMSGSTEVDTVELKTFCEETQKLLKDYVKHIETVEKKTEKEAAKQKFQNLINRGASFED